MPNEQDTRALRRYMCWAGDPSDCAVLVFDHTARHARRIAFPRLADYVGADYTDVRALWLKDETHLDAFRKGDAPHCVDSVPVCERCERWGPSPLTNNICDLFLEDCKDSDA